MNVRPDYEDLRDALEAVRQSVPGLRSVWCAPSMSFETKVIWKRGIIFGGPWSPQFLRQSDVVFSVPFTKILSRPRILLAESVAGHVRDWLPFLEGVAKQKTSLLMATDQIDDGILRCIIANAIKDTLDACAVRLGGSIGDRSIAFGEPLGDVPNESTQLPVAAEAWLRKDASVVFPDSAQDCHSVAEDIAIIEVGGEDFDDQQARLRFLSDTIRRSEWLSV